MALEAQLRTDKKTAKNILMRFLAHKLTLILITSLVLIMASGVTGLIVYTNDTGLFMPGITVAGVDIGNLSQSAAHEELNRKMQSINDHRVNFDLDGKALEC